MEEVAYYAVGFGEAKELRLQLGDVVVGGIPAGGMVGDEQHELDWTKRGSPYCNVPVQAQKTKRPGMRSVFVNAGLV